MAGAAPHHKAQLKSKIESRLRRGDTTTQIVNSMTGVNESLVKRIKLKMKQESQSSTDEK